MHALHVENANGFLGKHRTGTSRTIADVRLYLLFSISRLIITGIKEHALIADDNLHCADLSSFFGIVSDDRARTRINWFLGRRTANDIISRVCVQMLEYISSNPDSRAERTADEAAHSNPASR